MNRFTYLTPPLFRELDALARTFAGKPIVVRPAEEMKGYFGCVNPMATGLRIRLGDRLCKEMSVITLANKIDLDAFAMNKSGGVLDWSAIPAEDAYRFLAWHEIAHVIHVDQMLYFEMDINGVPLDIKRRVWRLAEVRADRHAWDVLYPGKEMPLLPGADEHLAEIKETARRHKAIFDKVKRKKPVEPLSTDPRDYVPLAHEKGIPWAPEVDADPLCLWGAVVDGRIVPAVREVVNG
jgi:hypothetical protein